MELGIQSGSIHPHLGLRGHFDENEALKDDNFISTILDELSLTTFVGISA